MTNPLFTVGTPSLQPPEPLEGSGGASGSGCNPGPGELPDGVWFGMVESVTASTVELDLACFYFGDIAYDIGDDRGEEVDNDYIIVNDNPALRTVPVRPGATVHELTSVDFVSTAFEDWPAVADGPSCPGETCIVWLYVNAGQATEIVEQFVP